MEVNGRVNRSILHSLRCGINFPWLVYRDLMLGEAFWRHQLSAPPRTTDPVYWIDLASDVRYSIRDWRSNKGRDLGGYLRPYRGRRVFAVGDGMDFLPFLKRSLETVETRLRRLGRRSG